MLSVVYVSSATVPFSKAALRGLLEQSREKNGRLGITGLLLYKDGNFMQAVEGPEEAVRGLYATISLDPRHRGLLTLIEEPVAERRFPDWAMGFRDLTDDALRALPGYSEFLNEPLDGAAYRTDPSRAERLLQSFRRRL